MRTDVMVDIETLGVSVDSPIFQVSAVVFNFKGETSAIFNETADVSNEKLIIEGQTLLWWVQNHNEMFKKLVLHKGNPPQKVLVNFAHWLEDLKKLNKNINLWGNGIAFDCVMLKHQMNQIKPDLYPIRYSRERDVRTFIDFAAVSLGIDYQELSNKLLEKYKKLNPKADFHCALEDCYLQVYKLKECLQIVNANIT